ncbi:cobalamin biosynthesis protein [Rhizorhapis suberifaciens]|uniref:Cobalt-precorrin 5A hydrolase n=1 Tax=Rhizorhapis suberifaciens TaxID=13656 RepID=A0A840HS13_9SPHN|nr:cobalamin biosynthesis protein [Rhizorhapis suberifaciens]MBB4640409.1 cobalt-precorrin 5A hydrolase [Rhizorhapis suberifaciens]
MIVAGFGFRKAADLSSLRAALALAQAGNPPVSALAAPDDKAPALATLAELLGLPLIAVSQEALRAAPTQTQSAASLGARATGSVAEAAALAAAGPSARLITSRHISPDRMASCAIAQGTLS